MITIIGNQIMHMHRNLQLVDRTQLSNYVWLCHELACECLTLLSARLRVLAGQIYRILLIRRATRIAFTLNIRLITDIIVFLGTTRSCSAIIGDQRRFLLFHQSNAIALVPWYNHCEIFSVDLYLMFSKVSEETFTIWKTMFYWRLPSFDTTFQLKIFYSTSFRLFLFLTCVQALGNIFYIWCSAKPGNRHLLFWKSISIKFAEFW